MAIFRKVRCEYLANSPGLESQWVLPIGIKSDFPPYQRQTQGLWESSDHWFPVVRWVRAIRAATLCQQVFPWAVLRGGVPVSAPVGAGVGVGASVGVGVGLVLGLEFQQQAAEFLCESALALVWARELVRGWIARLDLLGRSAIVLGAPVRVPKRPVEENPSNPDQTCNNKCDRREPQNQPNLAVVGPRRHHSRRCSGTRRRLSPCPGITATVGPVLGDAAP